MNKYFSIYVSILTSKLLFIKLLNTVYELKCLWGASILRERLPCTRRPGTTQITHCGATHIIQSMDIHKMYILLLYNYINCYK